MNQRFLTNFSIVAIKYFENDVSYCLSNQSFIRSQIFFTEYKNQPQFEKYLFYVETENNRQFNLQVQFEQPILFRHKISNKYLSFSQQFEEEENDTTFKLELSETKSFFKILPCFQYQTKISNKIKFNEDIYLATQLNSSKLGYVSAKVDELHSNLKKTFVGVNYKSKINLHSFFELEKQQNYYVYGQSIWISHIQTSSFLTTVVTDKRQNLSFQMIDFNDDLQSINGLWLLQSIKYQIGGKINFSDVFRLKNLSTDKYLSIKSTVEPNNQISCQIILEKQITDGSKFSFYSLKGQENKILKGSYLIFKNIQSQLFMGVRKKAMSTEGFYNILTFSEFEDEDLFSLTQLKDIQQQAIRFIFSVKSQLKLIKNRLYCNDALDNEVLHQIQILYTNIIKQLIKLSSAINLFEDVQEQFGFFLQQFCIHIQDFRGRTHSKTENIPKIMKIIKKIYEILKILCKEYRPNQASAFRFVSVFAQDIFKEVFAEDLLIEIFKNNYSLLCKIPNNVIQLKANIINFIFGIISQYSKRKNKAYWTNLTKIFNFLSVIIYCYDSPIDINQRLIATQLFQQKIFNQIFIEIKTMNQRIRIKNIQGQKFQELQTIKNPEINEILERIIKLLSNLCENRNFLSKTFINEYLNEFSKQGKEIFISYLNIPISKQLANNLYSLLTNLYIDSSPRINRLKPLPVLYFIFDTLNIESSIIEQQISGKSLKESLLNKGDHFIDRSKQNLRITNILNENFSVQPSLKLHELNLYKQQLNQRIFENQWSPDILKSIGILIKLQSYSTEQIIEIKDMISNFLVKNTFEQNIIESMMEILQELFHMIQEKSMKKTAQFLKYKFLQKNNDLSSEQIIYAFPNNKKLSIEKTIRTMTKVNMEEINLEKICKNFNETTDTISALSPKRQVKLKLFQMFSEQHNQKSYNIKNSIFKQIFNSCLPGYNYLRLMMNSIIITDEDIGSFQKLFQIYKSLKHLVSVSEHWFCCSGSQSFEFKRFNLSITQITNYFFSDYVFNSSEQIYFRRIAKNNININRQLTVRNLGVIQIILELLTQNFYILENKTRRNIQKKHLKVFQSCFQFVYYFCYHCAQNKNLLHDYLHILDKYRDLAQVGQTKLLIMLFKNEKDLIKCTKSKQIEMVIKNIVIDPKNPIQQNCRYNPEYLEYVLIVLEIQEKKYKPNAEIVYKIISKQIIFKNIFFQRGDKNKFCLDLKRLQLQPTRVPYIYHKKIIRIVCILINSLQSSGTNLKNKMKEIFSLEYFFSILSLQDIYDQESIQANLKFLLKMQILPLTKIYLEKNDSLSQLRESQNLMKLMNFYIKIFIQKPILRKKQSENQNLYLPFLMEYKDQIDFYKINQRDYYLEQVRPFLVKLYAIFQKFSNKQNNNIYRKIKYLLESIRPNQLNQNHLLKQTIIGIQTINLKWRNFIDNDQNNSRQQKFSKKHILEILRHKKTYQILETQKKQFYILIQQNQQKFIQSLTDLIRLSSIQQFSEGQAQQKLEESLLFIEILQDYSTTRKQENIKKICETLLDKNIIQILSDYISKPIFEYNKKKIRKIFNQILLIFNFLIENDEQNFTLKIFHKVFNENNSSVKLFNCLNEAISSMSERIMSQRFNDHINVALAQMTLAGEDKRYQIDKQSLKFIKLLCKYVPFTDFLRGQSIYVSIDFLDKIYSSLYFVLYKGKNEISISVKVVDIVEEILDCILAMFNGCNQSNQNYLIDNKFIDIVVEVLKMQKIKDNTNKGILVRRDRLLEEVIDFYIGNGIDVKQLLEENIKIIDFSHLYLLNRLKYSLLKVLINCINSNDRALGKVKILISLELVKINIIWIHEDMIRQNMEYIEENILRRKEQWSSILHTEDLKGTFLMVGFYYFMLIELINVSEKESEQEFDVANDEEKQKQKLVKKFFSSISESQKQKQRLKSLQKQQKFYQQMRMFYDKYYQAYQFFSERTLHIEANINGNLAKLYFPKMPLCDKISKKMQEKFINEVQRISQDEKIKGLLEFEQQFYERLSGQEVFQRQFEQKYVFFGKLTKIAQHQQQVFLIIWAISLIITILYMVQNFNNPSFIFSSQITKYITPISAATILMMIFVVINIVLAAIILMNIIFNKLPFSYRYYSHKYEKSSQKQEGGFFNHIVFYLLSNIVFTFFSDMYVVIFAILSAIHPLFSGFLLLIIVKKISLGQAIVQAIEETWFNLIVATALLIVFNYIFAISVYVFFTDITEYGPLCSNLTNCLYLLFDQNFKSGTGFLASYGPYDNLIVNFQFLAEIIYVLFAQKVIFQIFSGTIIDKFSELRQRSQQIKTDQESNCYICGQQRFQIDFQLEGFEQHIGKTHNKMHYMYYLFYLRQKPKSEYGVDQNFISQCQEKKRKDWIPDGISILKQVKQQQGKVKQQENQEQMYEKLYQKKILQLKKLKNKLQTMNSQLKIDNFKQ